jgi:hypothetical protein
MKLFLMTRKPKYPSDYETYDSFVCAARNKYDALCIHPSKDFPDNSRGGWFTLIEAILKVDVKYLGEADPSISRGVIMSEFRSG